MAGPPVQVPKQNPTGFKVGDGYQTLFMFGILGASGQFPFWEKEVKPVGIDGGEFVDTTTMRNSVWRTYAARHLKTLTTMTANVAWDPDVLPLLYNGIPGVQPPLINSNGMISVYFPDHSSINFYGYMVKFEPGEHKEGEMPIAAMTVQATNQDETTAEQAPTFTASGT